MGACYQHPEIDGGVDSDDRGGQPCDGVGGLQLLVKLSQSGLGSIPIIFWAGPGLLAFWANGSPLLLSEPAIRAGFGVHPG